MVIGVASVVSRAREIAASVVDPEIPVLTIDDLGVLRDVRAEEGGFVVTITPTYSGCPAMRQIEDDIVAAFARVGMTASVEVRQSPAWTTDWISDDARRRLEEFGIAPPIEPEDVQCPTCRSESMTTISLFGSTACKALMVCSSCGDPFDYFKRY